jgi:hypothetical protein
LIKTASHEHQEPPDNESLSSEASRELEPPIVL